MLNLEITVSIHISVGKIATETTEVKLLNNFNAVGSN